MNSMPQLLGHFFFDTIKIDKVRYNTLFKTKKIDSQIYRLNNLGFKYKNTVKNIPVL